MSNNYSDIQLNMMSLIYANQLAVNGQISNLMKLGVSQEQALRLSTLNGGDIQDIATRLNRPVVAPAFDSEALDEAFDLVERRRRDQEREIRLILAGATYTVMQRLTGMNPHLFSSYRQQFGLAGEGNGRPTQPDQHATAAVWGAWRGSGDIADEAERLLRVHDITGCSVRDICQIVQAAAGPGRESPANRPPARRPDRRPAIQDGPARRPPSGGDPLAWLYDDEAPEDSTTPIKET